MNPSDFFAVGLRTYSSYCIQVRAKSFLQPLGENKDVIKGQGI